MERIQSDKQSSTRLRSKNKRVSYRIGLKTIHNKIEKMKPIAKKKLTERGQFKNKKLSRRNVLKHVEYICSACNRVFKRMKDFKIHEKRGCNANTLELNLSTSNEEITWDGQLIPKLILPRLTDETLQKYMRKAHSTEEFSKTAENPAPTFETLEKSSFCKSGIAAENLTTEILGQYSSHKGKFTEESNITQNNRGSQTVPRRSSRMAASAVEGTTDQLNPEIFSMHSDAKTLLSKESDSNKSSKLSRPKIHSNGKLQVPAFANKSTSKTCKVCHFTFPLRKQLLSHLVTHSNLRETRFRCSLCPNTYHRKQSLDIHVLNQHTSLRPYHCPYPNCDSSFAIRPYLTRHMQTGHHYSAKEVNVTPKESEIFPAQKQSQNYEQDSKIEMRCPLCNHVCISHLALVNHMMRHKAEPVNEGNEGQHESNHSDAGCSIQDADIEKKFICQICSQEFSTNQLLAVHLSRHKMPTDPQPPKNEVIPNNIKVIGGNAIKSLIKSPRKERKSFMGIFKCNSCAYSTKYFGSLNKHELKAHNHVTVSKNTVSLPNFIHCQLCSYATRYKCNMTSHQKRIHDSNGSKASFSCELCSFSTMNVPDWKNHQLQAHNVRPINTCKKCNVVFASYSELRCHRMKRLRGNTSCDSNLQPSQSQQPLSGEISAPEEEEVKDEVESEAVADCVVVDNGKYLHACKTCGKKFARKNFLEKHVDCVHSDNKLSLSNPKENENEKVSLPPHKSIPKTTTKKVKAKTHNQCPLCLVVCVNASALEKHLQRHQSIYRV